MIWRVKRKWERAKVHKPNTTFYFGLTTYELVPEYERSILTYYGYCMLTRMHTTTLLRIIYTINSTREYAY